MLDGAARPLLRALGKSCSAKGVMQKSELPLLISALERFLAEQTAQKTEDEEEKSVPVSLKQRAWPLLQMMRRTRQAKKEGMIFWEAEADFEDDAQTV